MANLPSPSTHDYTGGANNVIVDHASKEAYMTFTMNLYYTGSGDAAHEFAQAMTDRGIVGQIRQMPGNLRYQYFYPADDPHTVLLIDSWQDQESLDAYHQSPLMAQVAALREQYDLHMTAERYARIQDNPEDAGFIRK